MTAATGFHKIVWTTCGICSNKARMDWDSVFGGFALSSCAKAAPLNVTVKRVKTSNGKIVLEKTRGDTEVETSNGKIAIENVTGNIKAETSNGAIEIEDVKGFVTANTSNGAIDVEGVGGVVELETSNGAIEAEVPAIGDNGLRVRTNNGKIELYLASDLNVDIEAKTSNNDIELDEIEVVAQEISRNRLRGKIGAGGKKVSIKTSNGGITLRKLKQE